MTDLQEIAAVWKGETVRATRSGRVLALLILFVMFVSLTLAVVGFVTRQLNATVDKQLQSAGVDAGDERMKEQLNQGKRQMLSVVITDDEEMLESLLTLPVVLLFGFKLTLRFVPLFVALMGFDQLAG
ncbi:MAG: ABC transporter permease, partial [Myxococcaceae bacterium]|nr:ABC transporter permease [Myxococcaceae bacterium]